MDFKIGDVVVLKSGGPSMTIKEMGEFGMVREKGAKCVWFEKNVSHEEVFALETLEKIESTF